MSITINQGETFKLFKSKKWIYIQKFIKNSDVIENAEKICFGFSDPKYSSSKKICSSIVELGIK